MCAIWQVIPFVKTKLHSIFKEKVLSVKWYLLSPNNVLLQSFWLKQKVLFVSYVRL